MTTPDPVETLAQALVAAEAALAAEDHAAAQAAVQAGVAACQAIDASGRPPTPAQLGALAATHARLLAQFTAMETIVSGFKTMGTFLTNWSNQNTKSSS